MTEAPADEDPRLGVVYDVDGVLRIAPLHRQIGRIRALVTRGPRDRRSLLGMTRLLDVLAHDGPGAAVHCRRRSSGCRRRGRRRSRTGS